MEISFDKEQYKEEMEKMKLSNAQKNRIEAEMSHTASSGKTESRRMARSIPMRFRALAAAVAAVMLFCGMYFGFGEKPDSANGFTVAMAATAEVPVSGQTDSSVHSYGVMYGPLMMDKNLKYIEKDGFIDFFAVYHIDRFYVQGTNIRSISVRSEKKGVYFSLLPEEKYIPDNIYDLTDFSSIDEGLKDFRQKDSLFNSNYNREEFRTYAKPLFWPCDGFSYDNKDLKSNVEQTVFKCDRDYDSIQLILEGDHTDSQIAEWLEELEQIENSTKSGSERFDFIAEKIARKTFENAYITITVEYLDGTKETQKLKIIFNGIGTIYNATELLSFEKTESE